MASLSSSSLLADRIFVSSQIALANGRLYLEMQVAAHALMKEHFLRVLPYFCLIFLFIQLYKLLQTPMIAYPFHTGVISRPSEFRMRKAIRNSWAEANVAYDPQTTRVEFFVGLPNDKELIWLREEMWAYRDITIINMTENYYDLPQKTLALMMYKEDRCPRARCLIKSDSDNVLNIKLFEKLCTDIGDDNKFIFGECSVRRKVQRHGKWRIPRWIVPQRLFPKYCSTGIYMFAGKNTVGDIIQEVSASKYIRSQNFRRLPEDVLFTGIFPEKANIPRVTLRGLSFNSSIVSSCMAGRKVAFSVHMTTKSKNPKTHFDRMRAVFNQKCPAFSDDWNEFLYWKGKTV